ncbi:MAG: V-type ATP synthase subunit I, partial [Clostridia bacterium]|nr:V-type ATP synthase subunit I [Clostridia bacterium]
VAVAEMQKLNLVAMSYDRDKILNALQKTGATEIKTHYDAENTSVLCEDLDELNARVNRVDSALDLLSAEVSAYNKDNKVKSDDLKDGFSVSYREFMGANSLQEECDGLVEKINRLFDERRELNARKAKLEKNLQAAEIYSGVEEKFKEFSSTAHVKIKLGTIPATEVDNLLKAVADKELCQVSVIALNAESALIVFSAHKAEEGAEEVLQACSFTACPFPQEKSGVEVYAQFKKEIEETAARLEEISKEIYGLGKDVKTLKIYSDYLGFELEKLSVSEKMRATAKTILLEAYLPKEAEELVKTALDETTNAIYYEFSEPSEDEMPPTLYKNNKVVQNFESITNTYSPVNAREFDPNTVMAFFYSLFLGFIMADIGYGLLMLLGGGAIYLKLRGSDSGMKKLAGVFAIGGIFAILWGLTFASLFGIEVFTPLMPNPQNDRWGIMGIQVPSVLVISLEIGVVHLMAGYICKAVQCMRRGQFWDGILDGLVWAVFSIGMGLAIVGLIDEANIGILAIVGGVMAGASLLVAMVTAGRKEKLLGKFTKGFGAAYGIINYVSDILSYARLYGLMLSGAVIAQIISGYSVDFVLSGNVALIILAVVLMLVGHAFNLAIGLLGAYIHDARLQYVEFYGRFFEGEGELFAPLGSNRKYIKVINN